MRVNVGDVVLINYRTFDDELASGLFIVAYHEAEYDRMSNKFTGIKISSTKDKYYVPLDANRIKFLSHDSYINCNSQHRFSEDQVYKIIGTISPYYINKMINQLSYYALNMQSQLLNKVPDTMQFENLRTLTTSQSQEDNDTESLDSDVRFHEMETVYD